MSKFLLLARYTRDADVPLRLFESEQEAEKEAIRLEENPECIVREFPRVFELMFGAYVRPIDLFCVLVLRISDETGQIEASGPARVALDIDARQS